MRPGSPEARYAEGLNLFATVHHAHPVRQFRYAGVLSRSTPVDPFLGRRPQIDENPGCDRSGSAQTPTDDGDVTLLAAVEQAHVLFPGPVGELIHREIHAYLEVGHRFGRNTLIFRLAEQLLATAEHRPAATAGRRLSTGAIR